MILAAAFFLSIAIALLRGGHLRRFAEMPLRWGWVALIAFGLQIYQIYFPEPKAEGLLSARGAILVLSYALILAVVWKNRALPGIKIIGVGLVANFLVMLLNGGYMPITAEALGQVGHSQNIVGSGAGARVFGTKDIVLPHESTVAWWLSDIFVAPPPFPIPSVFSIGDVFIATGVFWLVQQATVGAANPTPKI